MLAEDPGLAARVIRWGGLLRPCRTEPLHYLSDARFNRLFAHEDHVEIARLLLQAGAPPDGAPGSGETPLHGAASLGEPGIASVLLEFGADPELRATYPGIPVGTPLDFAIQFGMVAVVDVLVRHGAKLLSPRMYAGAGRADLLRSALPQLTESDLGDVFRCAAVCDQLEVVDLLLDGHVEVNATIDGATALHWAAWEAKPRMVEHLLRNGADPTREDARHAMTPAAWARHRGRELGPRWGHSVVVRCLEGGPPGA